LLAAGLWVLAAGSLALTLAGYIPSAMERSTEQSALSDFDRQFLTKTALANIAQIQLGELAVARGENSEVRQFGRRMAVEHTRTLADANAIASQKSFALPKGADKEQRATREKLDRLSGAVFDHAYIEIATKLLEDAVELFQREATEGDDAEVKEWATSILPLLRDHLQMARSIASKLGV